MQKILVMISEPGGIPPILSILKELSSQYELVISAHEQSEKEVQILEETRKHLAKSVKYITVGQTKESLEKILDTENPDLILSESVPSVGNNRSDYFNYSASEGRKRGIPTVTITNYVFRMSQDYVVDPFEKPDVLIVPDDMIKSIWLNRNFPNNNICVIGSALYENLLSGSKQINKTRIKESLGIPKEEIVILYGSRPVEADYGTSLGYTEKDMFESFVEGVHKLPDEIKEKLYVIVRPHNREDPSWLIEKTNEYMRQNGNPKFIYSNEYPLIAYTNISDVIVSSTSNLLIEGTLFGAIGISLQPNMNGIDELPTNDLGITLRVTSSDDFAAALTLTLTDTPYFDTVCPNRNTFINYHTSNKAISQVFDKISLVISP